MKYRKKPVVIEAFQYKQGERSARNIPEWAFESIRNGTLLYDDSLDTLYVKTLEGDLRVSYGDYIIRGVQGEIYPCKPDIFEQTYEAVEEGKE